MSIFGAIASAFKSGTRDLMKEYGGSNDFLNAVCASCALIAYADGTLEEAEKKKAMDVLTSHSAISAVYQRNQIETALNLALGHAQTSSGKQELARQLDAVQGKTNGKQMSEDVFLVAKDVASSNSRGVIGEDEQRVLDKISKRLGVDPSAFEF